MGLLNRDTDYAVRAILHIANSDKKRVSTSELENELDLPRPFMRKLFQILQKKGVLKSHKGNNGGFSLAKNEHDIYLLDIIKIFQGEISMADCYLKKKICPNINSCPLRKKLLNIEDKVLNELSNITIASLQKHN